MSDPAKAPLLRLRGIAKNFGDKVALAHVDLDVEAGEVHVICGENGAGKSTLMNILAGILSPDAGQIELDGAPVRFADPIAAGRTGIGMVHQHFKLVGSMSVAENLFLNRQPLRFGLVSDRRAMRERARALIERYRFDLDPDAPVARLSVGQRQRVEVLKALAFDARILILDEPTAVLTPPEVGELLAVIAQLKARGRTILFITHKLREVKAASDRVTVLRLGRSVSTRPTVGLSEADIAHDMVGRDMAPPRRKAAAALGEPMLALSGLTVTTASGRRLLDGIDLEIRAGEIVGIAGVDGNGQTELVRAILGQASCSGVIAIDGAAACGANASAVQRLGVIPEDRHHDGLALPLSLTENLLMKARRQMPFSSQGWRHRSRWRAHARSLIAEYDIRCESSEQPAIALSGGNQQKLVIARELSPQPRLVIAVNPTRGLDLGATASVMQRLLDARARGAAVLLVHNDLDELMQVADRILVMSAGRLSDSAWPQCTREHIGAMMLGERPEAPAAGPAGP